MNIEMNLDHYEEFEGMEPPIRARRCVKGRRQVDHNKRCTCVRCTRNESRSRFKEVCRCNNCNPYGCNNCGYTTSNKRYADRRSRKLQRDQRDMIAKIVACERIIARLRFEDRSTEALKVEKRLVKMLDSDTYKSTPEGVRDRLTQDERGRYASYEVPNKAPLHRAHMGEILNVLLDMLMIEHERAA